MALGVTAGRPAPHGLPRAATLRRQPGLLRASTQGHGGTVSGLHVGPSGTNFLTLEIVEAPAP